MDEEPPVPVALSLVQLLLVPVVTTIRRPVRVQWLDQGMQDMLGRVTVGSDAHVQSYICP